MTVSAPQTTLEPIDLVRLMLARRRLLIVAPAAVAAAVVISGLFADRTWTAEGAMVPQAAGGNVSRLAGLAGQFGVAVPTGGGGQSPDFYADVLRSDGILRRLLAAKYTAADGHPIDLINNLVPSSETPERHAEFALRELRERISTTVGLKTGIVTVRVQVTEPELARAIVERAMAELNVLNVRVQQNVAAQERAFTDDRLVIARAELRGAEDRLEAFLRGNRTVSGTPQLVLQEERLRRDVSLRQQVVVGLTQSLEQSRIEEARNVPVLSVVEAPVRPALPDSRKLVVKGLFAAIATGTALLALLLALEWRRRFSSSSPEVAAEVDRLVREAAQDFKRPWRLLSRRHPPTP